MSVSGLALQGYLFRCGTTGITIELLRERRNTKVDRQTDVDKAQSTGNNESVSVNFLQ